MNNQNHFLQLFRYTAWANERCRSALEIHAEKLKQAVDLFVHILAAQRIWYKRIKSLPIEESPWDKKAFSQLKLLSEKSNHEWLDLIENLTASEFEKPVTYRNTKGIEFTTSVNFILTHTVNHGTHHRAQISRMIREVGGTPPAIDFIVFVRENI